MNFQYFKHWLKYTSIQSIAFLASLLIPHLNIASAQTTPKGGIDWIVVVDTSASMRGVGGTKNIFDQVKSSIIDFVNTARLGDSITLYTFDQYVTIYAKNITIATNEDRGKFKKIVNSLKANGLRTQTGLALQEALQTSAILNQSSKTTDRTVSIVFLTDGLEDVQNIHHPVPIPSNIQLLRQQECQPYIFFVSLGVKEHENQLSEFASNPALCGKGQVLRDPGGVKLNHLAENIRPLLNQSTLNNNWLISSKISHKQANILFICTLLLVLLIALIIICLTQRKTPLELVEDLRTRNRLEGALVVLEPREKVPEDEEISLTSLHKTKVCLSDLIPAIAVTNSDAELVLSWRAGKKNISLRCLKGVIFVNTKKINTEELYDEDIIEIGDVKLQFNWIAHQRPFEPNSEQTNF